MKIIVVANPKGGTGKSTLATHILVGLAKQQYKVLGIDLDIPQYSLYTYVENRKHYFETEIGRSIEENMECVSVKNEQELDTLLVNSQSYDFVIIDTPGNMNTIFEYAHKLMDLLVTPLNDSLFDIDVLVKTNNKGKSGTQLGVYGNFIWEERKNRALAGKTFKWIVLRNRLNTLFTKNKARIEGILSGLSKKIGFELGGGLMERVIYKQTFDQGLTVLDLELNKLTASQLSARQEIRELIRDILIAL